MSLSLAVNAIEMNSCVANENKLKFTSAMQEKLSDEQLMLKYAKGEAWAFEQLYSRHKGGLFRFCLRQLKNHARAEECFQEVWMKLINSRVNYQPKALFTTFLYRIAQNHVIDIIRKDKKLTNETELEEEFHSAEVNQKHQDIGAALVEEDKLVKLRNKIESLPIDQKTALLLKMDAGLSLEEIANVLDCGRETVKSRLRYATAKLKSLLGEEK